MSIKKFLEFISVTVLLPITACVVMLLPFVYFIEKIIFYVFSVLLIIFIVNKNKWLDVITIWKIIYMISLLGLWVVCLFMFFMINIFEHRQIRERDIYTSGIYCIVETTSWNHEIDVQLIRYNLYGSKKGDSFGYKGAECKFQIKKNNEDVFLDANCDASHVEGGIGDVQRRKFTD